MLDAANNVQVVRPNRISEGDLVIDVVAISDMIWGPQDFALVVTGDLRGDLVAE